jgi:hypothetical protein
MAEDIHTSGINRSVLSEKLMEAGFNYWFSDHEHVRSPFPKEISPALRKASFNLFSEWLSELKDEELEEMDEGTLAEMFETFLFSEALNLVQDEEQRLTIIYPFMPRPGDKVNHKDFGEGIVKGRKEILLKENRKLIELILEDPATGKTFKTEFELS